MADTEKSPGDAPNPALSAPGGGARVTLSDVSKHYGEVTAVDRVTLEVAAGEFVTLLGPSGSGKSTVLNILSGFTEPDHGDVLVEGRSILDLPAYRRGFGIVFQSYAIFPHLTVYENVAFPLRMRRIPSSKARKAVHDALALVNLQGMESRYASQLSGGQQQRVAFARAVVFGPKVLLMDEPLSALDKNLRQQLQIELRRLHKQLGITIILVTHDQEEALAMSDRIAVMDSGRIVQIGRGPELYEHPKTEFVARFFGESNQLRGRIAAANGAESMVLDNGLTLGLARRTHWPPESKVRAILRPDRIRVVAGNTSPGYAATVEDVTYLGEIVRIDLRLEGGLSLIARMPSAASSLRKGDSARLSWNEEDVQVFREEADGREN